MTKVGESTLEWSMGVLKVLGSLLTLPLLPAKGKSLLIGNTPLSIPILIVLV